MILIHLYHHIILDLHLSWDHIYISGIGPDWNNGFFPSEFGRWDAAQVKAKEAVDSWYLDKLQI